MAVAGQTQTIWEGTVKRWGDRLIPAVQSLGRAGGRNPGPVFFPPRAARHTVTMKLTHYPLVGSLIWRCP